VRSLGQVGYEAYGATAEWKTFDGRPMPTWDDLGKTDTGRETQRRWDVAALAIREAWDAQSIEQARPPCPGPGWEWDAFAMQWHQSGAKGRATGHSP